MRLVWKIQVHQTKAGYQVRIDGEHGSAIGKGPDSNSAYKAAEAKLIFKPWLVANRDTPFTTEERHG